MNDAKKSRSFPETARQIHRKTVPSSTRHDMVRRQVRRIPVESSHPPTTFPRQVPSPATALSHIHGDTANIVTIIEQDDQTECYPNRTAVASCQVLYDYLSASMRFVHLFEEKRLERPWWYYNFLSEVLGPR